MEWEGIDVMSATAVVLTLNGMMRSGVLDSDDDVGNRKCQIDGTPAVKVVQRTSSLSQSTWPRRSLEVVDDWGRAVRRGTDS